MKRPAQVLVAVASLFGLLIASSVSAHNEGYPITAHFQTLAGPMNYPGTGNTWCPKSYDGTYASAYFTQTISYVNYGGTCNAQWGYPPAGTLRAAVNEYGAGGAVYFGGTGWQYNTASQRHFAQATFTHNQYACLIYSYHEWKYAGGSWSSANSWHVHHTCAH